MVGSVKEALEKQYEQVVEQLSQNMIQFAIMQNTPSLLQGIQSLIKHNIEMLVQEKDRIKKGLDVLEDSEEPEDVLKAIMIAHTGYAETVH